jgi:hypothetical protein
MASMSNEAQAIDNFEYRQARFNSTDDSLYEYRILLLPSSLLNGQCSGDELGIKSLRQFDRPNFLS